jgi:uncharacterized spore protein YtfJ
MMDVSDTLESVKNAITDRLTVQTAYGEPVTVDGVTIIPVARIALGFGAGGGVGEAVRATDGEDARPVGGGGGGGGGVQPLGFIEIDATGARWVPLEPSRIEVALRALTLAAVLWPFGGRRFLIGRLLTLLIGQVLVGRLSRPSLPSIANLRFGRGLGEEPA